MSCCYEHCVIDDVFEFRLSILNVCCSLMITVLLLVSSADYRSTGSDVEESCEASDLEKQRAATAIDHILSVLIHYSESTGRSVCRKRCNSTGTSFISSSLHISLGRIKQSFVL